MSYAVEADGEPLSVEVIWDKSGPRLAQSEPGEGAEIIPVDEGVIAWQGMRQHHVRFASRRRGDEETGSGGMLRSPMPGRLSRLFVKEGDEVALGDSVAIVEAMKMEHVLHAPAGGTVKRVFHAEGAQVDLGSEIVELETSGQNASD